MHIKVDELIVQIYTFFKQSPIRRNEFKSLSLAMEEGVPLKFKSLSGTRWIAHYGSLKRINSKWTVLQKYFSNVSLFLTLILRDVTFVTYIFYQGQRIKKDRNVKKNSYLLNSNILKIIMNFMQSILKEVKC